MAIPGRGRAHPSSDTSAAHARDSRPHRHPGFWPDPAGFDPRRFLPGGAADTATRHRYAFIPFGGGRRACIGASFAELETVLVLATMARRFRLELTARGMPPPRAQVTLRPGRGLPMRLRHR